MTNVLFVYFTVIKYCSGCEIFRDAKGGSHHVMMTLSVEKKICEQPLTSEREAVGAYFASDFIDQ